MTDRPANTGEQGGERPLFENMDEQERLYAPEEVPDAELPPEEVDTGGTAASGTGIPGDVADTPAAIPMGTGGSGGAVPPATTFEPGLEREERDISRDEEGYVGPDMRDERVKPAGSVTQQERHRPPDE